MRLHVLAIAAALALLAGCNKGPDNRQSPPRTDTPASSQPQVNTPSTPASAGQVTESSCGKRRPAIRE